MAAICVAALLYHVYLAFSLAISWNKPRDWCSQALFLFVLTLAAYAVLLIRVLLRRFLPGGLLLASSRRCSATVAVLRNYDSLTSNDPIV